MCVCVTTYRGEGVVCGGITMFSKLEEEFLASERVARIATINVVDKSPHVVPVCFAFDGKAIYTTLYVRSRRLKNVREGSKVSVLVDRYVEEGGDWKVLCGLLIYGNVKVLSYFEDRSEFMRGWKLLMEKYPQYRQWAEADLSPKDPDKRRIMRIQPTKATRWGFEMV